MALISLLNRWKKDPGIGANFASWLTIPAREPAWSPFPEALHPAAKSTLENQGVRRLYRHQERCWQEIQRGKHVVLSTGTASGKSLAYQLPILSEILNGQNAKALLLFPTKALARDQLAWWDQFPTVAASPYDGDTPQKHRKAIRETADIIVTNPDMLHLGILPYHTHWAEFLSQLKFIILDEIHIYRGVFGSHLANLIRRLKRVTSHYGANPQFILTSATIGNPLQLAASLLEEDLTLIDKDASSRGEKHFLIYNPPIIDPTYGLRASMHGELVRLTDDLLSTGLQTIIFARSRRSVEFLLTRLRERSPDHSNAIQAYRSGYLPEMRRALESGLRSGEIKCIAATTALELGIDIGGLDVSLLAGYPGTISATWQQAGRSGRGEHPSLTVLFLSPNPLDQYIALTPDFLFSSHPEFALINPDNLLITLSHLKCAAYELPFEIGESFGTFGSVQTAELLSILENLGDVYGSGSKFFWMSDGYPAGDISLRTTSPQQVSLQLTEDNGQQSLLGTIDLESAIWMVHPGAVYLHLGDSYRVEDLDLENNKALLVPHTGDYYTEAVKNVAFECMDLLGQEQISGATKYYGEIQVTSTVNAYQKISWNRYQVLGKENLDLPSSVLNSMGFWISLTEDTENILRESGEWDSSPNDYGPGWKGIREEALIRDNHTCAICGTALPSASLHVHHKTPLRSFRSLQEANQLSNLISLCPRCHRRAETVVRVKSGLAGLGYLLHNLAPLLLMCDPGDLGLYTELNSPLGFNQPTVLLYEQVPAGIGFSHFLFERISELIEKASAVVGRCPCENGCPGCVGPGGELGSGSKEETRAILNLLC